MRPKSADPPDRAVWRQRTASLPARAGPRCRANPNPMRPGPRRYAGAARSLANRATIRRATA